MMVGFLYSPRRCNSSGPAYALLLVRRQEEAQAAAAAAKRNAQGDGGGSEAAADTPREAVSIRGMVGPRHGGLAVEETAPQLTEVGRSSLPPSQLL